jgi:hypothetical protein
VSGFGPSFGDTPRPESPGEATERWTSNIQQIARRLDLKITLDESRWLAMVVVFMFRRADPSSAKLVAALLSDLIKLRTD